MLKNYHLTTIIIFNLLVFAFARVQTAPITGGGGLSMTFIVRYGNDSIIALSLNVIIRYRTLVHPNDRYSLRPIFVYFVNRIVYFCFRFPTVDGTDGGAVWPQLDSNKNPLFLHIDSARPKIIKSPFEKAYQFWSRIYSHFGRGAPQRSPEMKTEL